MGLRELVLVALVVLVLYGRSGVLQSRQAQTILPWISPRRRTGVQAGRPRASHVGSRDKPTRAKPFLLRGNRLYWFLTILAATAVAALIITPRDHSRRGEQGTHSLSWVAKRALGWARLCRSQCFNEISLTRGT